jgi:diadenosine tetraphosphatase ApaH/serine/threonine PP2A family protein phosphatase
MEQPRAIVTLDRPAKYLVNVGSVGQNRDRDPRACYTIFDTDNNVIQFRRIGYDVRATQEENPRRRVCPNCSLGGWSSDCEPE